MNDRNQTFDERPPTAVMRQEFTGMVEARMGETASTAIAAAKKAQVEARCVIAFKIGRNWDNVRAAINMQCADPDFACEALYAKPIGAMPAGFATMTKRDQLLSAPESWPRGLSIRFIESVIQEAGSMDVQAVVTFEDEYKRITEVSVWDLYKNNQYQRTVITEKTVERSTKPKNEADIISQRINSWGKPVYLIPATKGEVDIAEAAGVSKSIRTMGERLIPAGMKREWEERLETTLRNKTAEDPEKEKKRILDLFFKYGVLPSDLEEFIGHPLHALSPAELAKLRGVLVTVSTGESSWKDVMSHQKHSAEADYEPGSEGERAVAEALAKQKKKMEDQAASASSETAKTAGAAVPTTKAAESKTEPVAKSDPPPAAGASIWKSREEMIDAMAQASQGLTETEAWTVLGNFGIGEAGDMGFADPNTFKACQALKVASDEKANEGKPNPPNEPTPITRPRVEKPKFGGAK